MVERALFLNAEQLEASVYRLVGTSPMYRVGKHPREWQRGNQLCGIDEVSGGWSVRASSVDVLISENSTYIEAARPLVERDLKSILKIL